MIKEKRILKEDKSCFIFVKITTIISIAVLVSLAFLVRIAGEVLLFNWLPAFNVLVRVGVNIITLNTLNYKGNFS